MSTGISCALALAPLYTLGSGFSSPGMPLALDNHRILSRTSFDSGFGGCRPPRTGLSPATAPGRRVLDPRYSGALQYLICSIYKRYYMQYIRRVSLQSEQHDGFGFLLSDVSRLMRRAFQSRLRDTDLTLAQARTLVHLSRREGLRQVELADLLEIQPINLARLIDQLTAKELVERRADPTDRRAYRLFLHPAQPCPWRG